MKQTVLRVDHFKQQITSMKETTDQLRDKVNENNDQMKSVNENIRGWYDDYMGRTIHANKLLMEEIDRVRGRVVSTESSSLTLLEKVR